MPENWIWFALGAGSALLVVVAVVATLAWVLSGALDEMLKAEESAEWL